MNRPDLSKLNDINIQKDMFIGFIMILAVSSAVGIFYMTDFSEDIDSDLHLSMDIEVLEVSGISDTPVVKNSVSITTSNCNNSLQNVTTTDRGRAEFDVFLNETDDISFCLQDLQSDSISLDDLYEERLSREEFNEAYYFKIVKQNITKIEQ